jgi:hypothetical protein
VRLHLCVVLGLSGFCGVVFFCWGFQVVVHIVALALSCQYQGLGCALQTQLGSLDHCELHRISTSVVVHHVQFGT